MSSTEPTTRSRTLFFLSIRDSRAPSSRFRSTNGNNSKSRSGKKDPFVIYEDEDDDDDNTEQAQLLRKGQSGHVAIDILEPPALPPAWVEISERVETILHATRVKINALDKLHDRHALPGFTDRTAEERDIERMTTEITRDFRQCHSLIQKIVAEPTPLPINEHSGPSTSSNSQNTYPPQDMSKRRFKPPSANAVLAAKNVQRGLAAKVQETSGLFRKKQKVYMDRLQGHAIKNQDLLIASGALSLHGSEGLSAVEEDMAASRSQLSSQSQLQQQQQVQQVDAQTQERTREITEIAKSIATLADLFKDLSTLVIEQGTILDSVEYNIERTADEMQTAVKELTIAQGYQRNTGRRQCILFLVLLIFAALVVLILKPKRRPTPPPPPSGAR